LPETSLTLEQKVVALEARLTAVEDVLAIQNLKAHYGALADRRYEKGDRVAAPELDRIAREISELFTHDAVWDGGAGLGVCTGREAIYERFRSPTLTFSWHYFVKPKIAVAGSFGRASWDILAPCTTQEHRAMWMAGREDDEYRKEDGVWLHSSMKLFVTFMAPHEGGWAKR
jgi:hypothetical protein